MYLLFYAKKNDTLDQIKYSIKLKKSLKIIGIAFLLLIVAGGLFVFNTISQYGKICEGELDMSIPTDTIPFTYSASGHILISAKINKSDKDYSFILDSGASSIVFPNLQKEIQLENNGFSLGQNSSGNFSFSRIKKIDSIHVGNFKFSNFNADDSAFNVDCVENVYGVIGIGVMRHLVWNIDFEKKLIIVSRDIKNFRFQEDKIEIPLEENQFSHHLNTYINFRKRRSSTSVTVDLGNSGSLSLRESDILFDSIDFRSATIFGRGSTGLGDDEKRLSEEKYYLLDTIYLEPSNHFVNNFQVKSSPAGLNLLGLGFFKSYKTTISWLDQKLILEPYSEAVSSIYNDFGFHTRYEKEENRAYVSTIIESSHASILNIPLHSEVISINGIRMNDLSVYCEYKLTRAVEDSIILELKHEGSIKKFVVRKEYLFN